MSHQESNTRSTVIPCLRYRDAPAAIQWLCEAFGFQRHAVHANPDGSIAHAQLTFGNGMVMLGSVPAEETPWGCLIRQPDGLSGAETQSPYVIVADVDRLYERAKAVGAEIAIDIEDKDYGGRGFTCRDPEGHLWNFGSYDPWYSVPGNACPKANSNGALRQSIDERSTAANRAGFSPPWLRLLGDFDLAEEALHDAFRAALEQWPRDGLAAGLALVEPILAAGELKDYHLAHAALADPLLSSDRIDFQWLVPRWS